MFKQIVKNNMQGIIIKNISNDYTIFSEGMTYVCKARGRFRKDKIIPLVGDICIFDSEKKYIIDILKRKTELIRPAVANIDQAVIVTSVKDPNFDSCLLDKLLCIIEYNNIEPIICLTKIDLRSLDELENI